MASTRTKKRKKSSSNEPLIRPQRKKEILGLILMALAVLVSLALVTYHPVDNTIARTFSLEAALNPAETQAENALGLVGATLAWLLIPNFLGYPALAFPLLTLIWGYTIFRHRQIPYLPFLSILTVIGTVIGSTMVGWFGQTLDADLIHWSGSIGLGTAGWMQRVFGTAGSFILLTLGALITLLLAIDHDIQRSIDRLVDGVRSLQNWIVDRTDALRTWWSDWRAEQARLREERRAARDDARQQREAKRQHSQQKKQSTSSSSQSSKQKAASPTDAPPSSDSAEQTPQAPRPSSPEPTASDESSEPSYSRRNDLFRTSDAQTSRPPESTPSSDASDATSTRSQDEPEEAPKSKEPAEPQAASSDAETASSDVEMQVQEQIEEEKAEDLDRAAEPPDETIEYTPPPIDLLDEAGEDDHPIDLDELEQNKQILLDKLDTYNIEIQNIKAVVGPTVTRYELTPAPGIKVSRIKSLEDDLAMAMAAQGIRMIAPIPGKSAVGVEIPNRHRELVRLRDVIGTAKFRDTDMELPIPVGKTIEGEVFLADLTKMPHLLIAGATGSGKSVGLNALITSFIYACHPANLKFVIIDPKKIELQQHALLEDHFLALPEGAEDPVITEVDQALGVLKSCEKEMEERYDLLSKASVRDIRAYNEKFKQGNLDPADGHRHMPYVVVVVDELADLMMTAGSDIEGPIARLAQMARAVGIHLVLATQRPSVDVITGLIKANFPSRMAYQVASRVDSRTILDQIGAEGLVGNGDLLYMSGSRIKRLQGPFVSIQEVERVNEFVADQQGFGPYELPSLEESGHGPTVTLGVEDTDELFEKAAHVIVRNQQGSVSLLQRKLAVGYTRAARIVDQLEEAGIVGEFQGTKARDVLVDSEEELDELLNEDKSD